VATSDDANLKVIISRIQQRRGLKQDLPQPLRPGEIGFATDSRQVYIGADTADTISKTYNKSVFLENTLGSQARTLSLANNQIIKFTVPHIKFPKGSATFDGVSKSQSWTANTNITVNSGIVDGAGNTVNRGVFDANVSGNDFVKHNQTGVAFNADDVTVLIDGVKQAGDSSGTGAVVNTSFDYNFVTGSNANSDHNVYFRTPPTNSQDVAITYYGNAHVNHTISNTVIASGAAVTGFHANMSIPSYRYLNSEYIVVNEQIGTGFIGLETKHIDVVAEGQGVSNIANVSLGKVVAVKDSQDPSLFSVDASSGNVYAGISANATVASGEITVDMGADSLVLTKYDTANIDYSTGYNSYVWFEGKSQGGSFAVVNTPHYLHRKLLPVKANSTGSSFIIDVPANTFQTARAVTTGVASSGTVTITGNVDGLSTSDYVKFIGSNNAQFNDTDAIYQVQSVGTGNFTVTEPSVTSAVSSNLDYINYGTDNTGANVQIFSASHGIPGTTNVTFDTAVGGISASTSTDVLGTPTQNAFFIPVSSAVTANVTGNTSPVLDNIVLADGLTVTGGYMLDLSGKTTLTGAIGEINSKQQWVRMSLKPDVNDEAYIYSNDQSQYRLFDDPQADTDTWSAMGILPGYYTRASHTVKAKLETWIKRVLADNKVNIITNAYINDVYGTETFDSYGISLDTTNAEIDFTSSDEAGNFAELVNKLYFKSSSPDKRGLATIKTNIELLTTASQEAGQSVSTFTQPQQLTIGSNSNVLLTALGTDTSVYDTVFVDYSLTGQTLDPNDSNITLFYNRVGTMSYIGNQNADRYDAGAGNIQSNGAVTIQDISSEITDTSNISGNVTTVSGNIQFNASMTPGSNTVNITANNSIQPATSNVVMKYIVRRWKS
jgi:hypothetical protein